MKLNRLNRSIFMLLLLAFVSACNPNGGSTEAGSSQLLGLASDLENHSTRNIEEGEATLSLLWDQEVPADELKVILKYARKAEQVAPRAVELFINYPETLQFQSSEPLSSLILAGKDLIIQQPQSGVLRLIVMSTGNLNSIESGPLAKLTFSGRFDQQGELSIQERRTYFAPADANLGVTLDTPLKTKPSTISE